MSLTAGMVALTEGLWFPVGGNEVPAGDRYAVLWVPPGKLSAEDVANTPDLLTVIFSASAVGRGGAEAEAVATDLRDALVGKTPAVPGWTCGPVEQVDSQYPRRDDDRPDMTVYIATAQYQVRAART